MKQFKRCKVVMLPTNEKAHILLQKRTQGRNNLSINPYVSDVKSSSIQYQHLYITSDDEIKEDDWYLQFYPNGEFKNPQRCKASIGANFKEINSNENCKKIIATTDSSLKIKTKLDTHISIKSLTQPSQSFIEVFVREYNKGNVITDVLVEYEEMTGEELGVDPAYFLLEERLKLKINPKDNTITIKKLKDNYSREEVIELIRDFEEQAAHAGANSAYLGTDKWIEENL